MLVRDKLEDIENHPENHRHTFEDLVTCCIVKGILSIELLEAHQKKAPLGTNGGVACDTIEGPCACGAWHTKDERRK